MGFETPKASIPERRVELQKLAKSLENQILAAKQTDPGDVPELQERLNEVRAELNELPEA